MTAIIDDTPYFGVHDGKLMASATDQNVRVDQPSSKSIRCWAVGWRGVKIDARQRYKDLPEVGTRDVTRRTTAVFRFRNGWADLEGTDYTSTGEEPYSRGKTPWSDYFATLRLPSMEFNEVEDEDVGPIEKNWVLPPEWDLTAGSDTGPWTDVNAVTEETSTKIGETRVSTAWTDLIGPYKTEADLDTALAALGDPTAPTP